MPSSDALRKSFTILICCCGLRGLLKGRMATSSLIQMTGSVGGGH